MWGFPGGLAVRNPPASAGGWGLIPAWGRFPEEGNGNPPLIFLPGKSQGQRSLEGYSLWGHPTLLRTEDEAIKPFTHINSFNLQNT